MANHFQVLSPAHWRGKYLLPYSVGRCDFYGVPKCGDSCVDCCKSFEFPGEVLMGVATANNLGAKWFHYHCFWKQMYFGNHPIYVNLVFGIDQLPLETQEKVKKDIIKYQLAGERNPGPYGRKVFRFTEDRVQNEADVEAKDQIILVTSQHRVDYGLTSTGKCAICSEVLVVQCFQIVSVDMQMKAHYRCVLKAAALIVGTFEEFNRLSDATEEHRSRMRKIFDANLQRIQQNKKIWPYYLRDVGETEKTIVVLSTSVVFISPPHLKGDMCQVCNKAFSDVEILISHNFKYAHFSCVLRASSTIFEKPNEIPRWSTFPEWVQILIWDAYNTAIAHGVRGMTFPRPTEHPNVEQIDTDDTHEERVAKRNQQQQLEFFMKHFQSLGIEAVNDILTSNQRDPSENPFDSLVDLVDITIFGVPVPCPVCNGYLKYIPSKRGYICCGNASSFTRCHFFTRNPDRHPMESSEQLENYLASTPGSMKCKERIYVEDKKSGSLLKCAPQKLNETYQKAQSMKSKLNWDKNYTSQPAGSFVRLYIENDAVYHASLKHVDVESVEMTCMDLFLAEIDAVTPYFVIHRLSTAQFEWSYTDVGHKAFSDVKLAKQFFEQMFFTATHQKWGEKAPGIKKTNYFFWNEHNYFEADADQNININAENVNRFVREIFRREQVNIPVEHILVKAKKMIFGKISPSMKKIARDALKELQLKHNLKTATEWDYTNAANIFFSLTPFHCDITSIAFLKTENGIMKTLERLENDVLEKVSSVASSYKTRIPRLLTSVQRVERTSKEWKMIKEYMDTGIGETHDVQYKLMDIFSLDRELDPSTESLAKFGGDSWLLWHGTRTNSIASILQNGFRLPTGERQLMFGNGIYFADVFTKSLFYCFENGGWTVNQREVYLLLCEVTMGKCCETVKAKNHAEVKNYLNRGFNSVKGISKYVKTEENQVTVNGIKVPTGPISLGTLVNLLYSEYVVYNPNQIRIKYVVKVQVDRAMRVN